MYDYELYSMDLLYGLTHIHQDNETKVVIENVHQKTNLMEKLDENKLLLDYQSF